MLFSAFLLGIIQAITEFLPISSTGHLIITKEIFNFDQNNFDLSFDIILHFGTLIALIFYFRKDLKEIFLNLLSKKRDNISSGIIIGVLPAIILGLIFKSFIENSLRNSMVVAFMLVFIGVFFILAEKISIKKRSLKNLNIKDAFLIGLAQALALIPGVSRSGITIISGLFLGFKREDAARFSFLLSIPVVFLASMKDILDLVKEGVKDFNLGIYLVGFITSALASFFVIKYFLVYLRKHSLTPFAYYRFVLAFLIFIII